MAPLSEISKRARDGEIDPARGRDGAVEHQCQGATVDRRRADIGVDAAQGEGAAALLDQPAGATIAVDDSMEGRRVGCAYGQAVVAQPHGGGGYTREILDRLRIEAAAGDIEDRAKPGEIHDTGVRYAAVVIQRQRGVLADRRGAGVGVRPAERCGDGSPAHAGDREPATCATTDAAVCDRAEEFRHPGDGQGLRSQSDDCARRQRRPRRYVEKRTDRGAAARLRDVEDRRRPSAVKGKAVGQCNAATAQ